MLRQPACLPDECRWVASLVRVSRAGYSGSMRGRRRRPAIKILMQWLVILVLGFPVVASPIPEFSEVVTLMAIKADWNDSLNILNSWFVDASSPCDWVGIHCNEDGFISTLTLTDIGLSGILSPSIGNLSRLQSLVLHNNSISGPIPASIGLLTNLLALDMSYNSFTGTIPTSIEDLKILNYMKLNNNNLTGVIPDSIANSTVLDVIDLSFNNLSGPLKKISAPYFNISGNVLICGVFGDNCSPTQQNDPTRKQGIWKRLCTIIIIVVICVAAIAILVIIIIMLYWWMCLLNHDPHDDHGVPYGNLIKFTINHLSAATNNFAAENILGRTNNSSVYKGRLADGTLVAVKKLTDTEAEKNQFITEIKVISLADHRNLIKLIGFCVTDSERYLVYPFMPNGSVRSKLTDSDSNLDWSRRRNIALDTARGLLFLHDECDEVIIHRDIKAANVLLNERLEAVIGDYGLARPFGHSKSHVRSLLRGTDGYMCPHYFENGEVSDKTDVFSFGIFLVHLISGKRPLDFENETVHDWVKKHVETNNLDAMVDPALGSKYNHDELETMVKVAFQCTQQTPRSRPRMSQILRVLDGDELTKKWEEIRTSNIPMASYHNICVQDSFTSLEDEESNILMASYHNICVQDSFTSLEDEELSGPR